MQIRKLKLLPDYYWGTSRDDAIASIIAGPPDRPVLGQFSIVHEDQDHVYLIRDRLGLNKLFYHIDADTRVATIGHYLYDIVGETGEYNSVKSVPAGHYLTIDKNSMNVALTCYWDLSRIEEDPEFEVERFQTTADRILTDFFENLQERSGVRQFFVCLSGGLDSSLIASYAKRYLQDVTAVTFSYEALSDDFLAGEAFAKQLGLAFQPIVIKRQMHDETLRQVISMGQDWRDFNVHCAWVNYQIARHLRDAGHDGEAIVLTGDLMNEYVCDYTPVEYGGVSYYELPRISQGRLRRFLVYGLDSGDRELGIFFSQGFTVVQPYSLLAEHYLSVPADMLTDSHCKDKLNLALMGNANAEFYEPKNKTRAQVGSSDGGTLGLFHDSGISQQGLEDIWKDIFLPLTKDEALDPVIRSGRYTS